MAMHENDHSEALKVRIKSPKRASRRVSMLLGAVALGALSTGALLQSTFDVGPAPAYAQNLSAQVPTANPAGFADVVDHVKPAVVSVRVKVAVEGASAEGLDLRQFGLPEGSPFERFFRRFGEEDQRGQRPAPRRFGEAQGSGFFISADGYVVTNNHVVEKAREVEIQTDDGKTYSAKVVGTDPKTDLALLKVDEGGKFPYVSFASGTPRVGDWVLAVGNPFGLGGTVTAGIVSARGRDIGAGPYDDFLQVDAAVNRGNSGGPTFNTSGEVVGVNTAIASPSGGNVGIAFAIPAETVQKVVAEIKDHGTVRRGYLGVQIQPINEGIAEGLGLEEAKGAIVARVEDGSPAAKAGIKSGDAILAVDGQEVKNARELARDIAGFAPGRTVDITVWRGGKKSDISVTLATMPGEKTASAESGEEQAGRLGLSLAPSGSVDGVDKDGVVVVGVEPGSPAEERGLRTGDVIVTVGGKKVETPQDVRQAVTELRKEGRKAVLMQVETASGARFVALPLA
ncbi:Do family serine endopeptidase [Chelatococcus sambhunathii]